MSQDFHGEKFETCLIKFLPSQHKIYEETTSNQHYFPEQIAQKSSHLPHSVKLADHSAGVSIRVLAPKCGFLS
jgi:hypothetical protein